MQISFKRLKGGNKISFCRMRFHRNKLNNALQSLTELMRDSNYSFLIVVIEGLTVSTYCRLAANQRSWGKLTNRGVVYTVWGLKKPNSFLKWISGFKMSEMMAGKWRHTMSEWDTQLPCAPMKTSNKALAVDWTHACTGLKLCPPFHTRSTEGTIDTLDTALKWSRRFTILSNKGELCAGEVTWKRTDKTPFWVQPGMRHPCRSNPGSTSFRC